MPVFPCAPGAKTPAVAKGFQAATCDKAQIDAWWTENPDYNVAIYPGGARQELAVIDLDPPTGENAWSALEIEHGITPFTRIHLTPRGGRHLFFRGSLPPSASKLGPKIDTRGRGSYVLVPPSRTDDGSYSVAERAPFAAIPDWIALALAARERSRVSSGDVELDLEVNVARARSYLSRAAPSIEGQGGDDNAFRVACQVLNFGLTPERGLALAMEPGGWNSHCVPPWDEEELAVKFANADTYAQNEPGAWAATPAAETFGPVLDSQDEGDREQASPDRFKLWTPAELRALPPLTWLVPEMIPERGVGMMYAPPDSYKSFLALAIVMPIAEQRDVVYVAGEGSSDFGRRIDAWCLANGVDRDAHRLTVVRAMPYARRERGDQEGEWQMLIKAIVAANKRPAMVVIDTAMQAMAGMSDSDSADASTFTRQMNKLGEALRSGVLFIHHTGKDTSRGARGSNAFEGDINFMLEVEPKHDVRAAAVWVRRQKDAERRKLPFCYEGRLIAGSVAFTPIEPADYRELVNAENQIAPRKIVALLTKDPITTAVLASMVRPAREGEDPIDHQHAVNRVATTLRAEAKKSLAALCHGEGHGLQWSLP